MQQTQHVGTRHAVPQCFAFARKHGIKFKWRDVAALQFGPRVVVGVHRVHRTDEVGWQAVGCLVVVEGLEWARQNDPTEIKKHSPKHALSVRAQASPSRGPRAG